MVLSLLMLAFVIAFPFVLPFRAYMAGLSQAQSPRVAHFGFWTLMVLGTKQDKPLILEALKSPDYWIRKEAVYWLQRRLGKEAQAHITPSLLDQDGSVVIAALRSLAEIKTEKTYMVMLPLNHSWEWVRREAAQALGKIGDPEAVDRLIDVFRQELHPKVRWKAVEALGKIKDPRAAKVLTEALACADKNIFEAAKEGLKGLGPAAKEALVEAGTSGNPKIQLEVLMLLEGLDEELAQTIRVQARQQVGRRLMELEALEGKMPKGAVSGGEVELVNARRLYNSGGQTRALDLLNAALRLDPFYTDALVLRGQVYEELGYPEQAFADYESAFRVDSGRLDLLRRMGRISQDQNWPSRLQDVYETAEQLFEEEAKKWNGHEDFLWKD
ncbi:MAG: HEAT repeat domain-containing protein [Elusimicrobia bacterium]|nr:HEAT repeat domain-containing protein [Elusimicrobiota bacterium]